MLTILAEIIVSTNEGGNSGACEVDISRSIEETKGRGFVLDLASPTL